MPLRSFITMPKGSSPGTCVHRVEFLALVGREKFVVGYDDGDVAQVIGEFVLVVAGRVCQGIVLYMQDTGFWGMGKGKMVCFKRVFISPSGAPYLGGMAFLTWHPGGASCGSCRDVNNCLKLHLYLKPKGTYKLCRFRGIYTALEVFMSLQRHPCRPMAQLLPVWD